MKSQSGQLFVENMVAISIIIIGLLSAFTLLSRTISFTRVVADQYIATNLVSEGIEIVKNKIDIDICDGKWFDLAPTGVVALDFDGKSPTSINLPLKFKDDDPTNYYYSTYNYTIGKDTKFYRTMSVDYIGDEATVISTVTWTNKAGSFEAKAEDHFFNWWNKFLGASGDKPSNCII